MEQLDTQLGNLARFPVKQRNALLDALFYDVQALAPCEQALLNPLVDREGTIVVVSPAAHRQPIRHYKSTLRFMNKEGDSVQAIAVAGVGSSVLGTAALARNLADHYGFDVAGLVTGYGMTDLLTEALGGWFFYGHADRLRYASEWTLENLLTSPRRLQALLSQTPAALAAPRPLGPAELAPADGAPTDRPGIDQELFSLPFFPPGLDARPLTPTSADARALQEILLASPANLKLIVGHSKGCLLTSYVLWHLVDELEGDPHPLYDTLTVVTLGTVVALPPQFPRRHQFLGQLDWFGGMNSRLRLPHTRIPGAWHHLNRALPMHLPVSDALRRLPPLHSPDLAPLPSPPRPARAAARAAARAEALATPTRNGARPRAWGRRNWTSADVL